MPRPAPNLALRREQLISATRKLAEAEGWTAVTMRRVASEFGVTQPVLYTVFAGRQAIVDAVVLTGFDDLATRLEAVAAAPSARMRAYLDFARAFPRTYEAMFSMPSGLRFATHDKPDPLSRAFAGIRAAFPDADGTQAELAWSALHGLATLNGGGRLRPSEARARFDLTHRILTHRTR